MKYTRLQVYELFAELDIYLTQHYLFAIVHPLFNDGFDKPEHILTMYPKLRGLKVRENGYFNTTIPQEDYLGPRRKPVQTINLKTKKLRKYDSVYACAKALKVLPNQVTQRAQTEGILKNHRIKFI